MTRAARLALVVITLLVSGCFWGPIQVQVDVVNVSGASARLSWAYVQEGKPPQSLPGVELESYGRKIFNQTLERGGGNHFVQLEANVSFPNGSRSFTLEREVGMNVGQAFWDITITSEQVTLEQTID